MKPFYKSRKFLLVVLDMLAGLIALYAVRLLPAVTSELVIQTWAIIQPVMVALIVGIAWEDSAALKAGTHPSQGG